VTSPTFTLVHEYTGGRLPLFHFDFYRLESEGEVLRIGLDDYLDAGGVLAIEWAGKFPALLPASTKWLRFHAGPGDERSIET
jgi:tRNA threonylcarbamoyladenosine biosynthesis protein TsaE